MYYMLLTDMTVQSKGDISQNIYTTEISGDY